MSGPDADEDRAEELTALYRAASARDPARPSDSVRRSILAYAGTLTAARATRTTATASTRRTAATDSGWPIAAAASVVVAALAALLAWHSHVPASHPAQPLNPVPANLGAHAQSESGSTVSSEPSESAAIDRLASPSPAPDAVTTRSRQRTAPSAEAARPAQGAGENPPAHEGSLASSRPAPPRATGGAPENAAAGSSATDAAGGRENRLTRAQVAPAAATPPPDVEARRSPAPDASAPARTGAAPASLLVTAADSGSLERVDQLLRSGISTEQTDTRGRTALLVATLRGDVPMVRRLLAAGARADAPDNDGDTPLAAARRQGPPELARLLERAAHL